MMQSSLLFITLSSAIFVSSSWLAESSRAPAVAYRSIWNFRQEETLSDIAVKLCVHCTEHDFWIWSVLVFRSFQDSACHAHVVIIWYQIAWICSACRSFDEHGVENVIATFQCLSSGRFNGPWLMLRVVVFLAVCLTDIEAKCLSVPNLVLLTHTCRPQMWCHILHSRIFQVIHCTDAEHFYQLSFVVPVDLK